MKRTTESKLETPNPILRSVLAASLLLILTIFTAAAGAAIGGPQLRLLDGQSTVAPIVEVLQAETGELENVVGHGGPTCVINPISCGSTVAGTLATSDCDLGGGIYVDFWSFNGLNGQNVTINASSGNFDTFLALLDPSPQTVAEDDDGGPGSNSRILFALNQGGVWTIAVRNFFVNDLGGYLLSLACAGGTGSLPAAPSNLTATASSMTEVQLNWTDNSNNESGFRIETRFPGGVFQDIGSVPANSTGVNVINLSPETAYDFRVRARNASGNSAYSNTASATTNGQPGQTCVQNAQTLCLQNDRFRVRANWMRPTGQTGFGTAVELTPDTGYFWFFNASNVEMVLKVLDNCNGFSHRFWVFAGGLTNVEVTMTVTDTESGAIKTYTNPLNSPFQPIQDTSAFATCP
jgi:Fibronectin type III domain/Bacterial pre-peptidase C-terminal domain